ncbi:hypothetical protein BIFGAL_02512 [Bifidobacterium gallicum DSM 20093 = LMG 11596]|uniref:Uncharacterized protein n=1 Tax=Bifidobacterium gallicum DSM 20093 = LMG 11596 TaxID=561180 RepID=D1NRW1_9BIFI|nr:hypothetical protein BIFGAL_02512 [Bifidobacterium gallicum DSM 20093 = LMG 11596]
MLKALERLLRALRKSRQALNCEMLVEGLLQLHHSLLARDCSMIARRQTVVLELSALMDGLEAAWN